MRVSITAQAAKNPQLYCVLGALFKNVPVQHIKDILLDVPGVITPPRMGDDARASIRGSGLPWADVWDSAFKSVRTEIGWVKGSPAWVINDAKPKNAEPHLASQGKEPQP
jgi:hypothetical protein